ncbi:hypothetical protein C8J56DRAFT_254538 [Mycena floridula]|nr:hypothetical protein C8J56DRAFT_254538 [Mycena floridula]
MYNRDWDRGKDNSAPWAGNPALNNVRSREEDYYGDGKRRKINEGGYEAHSYGEANYSDLTPQQKAVASIVSAFIPKKRLQPSEPSPHVIFLGLDPDFTEADLQAYLAANGCTIETVTIIRERSSGASKGFGFAQFPTTEHARGFVDPLFPFIQVPPPASHGASATAAFYKALETGLPHNGRRVKIDYSQSASPTDKGRFNRGNLNDGTRDIGNSPAPVLLFRGLDPLSGPQAIHQAMRLSSGVGKDGAIGMKRILVIKDRVTLASFGFAFVEFVDIPSASAALGATMSPQIHPSGFRISDRPVAASFAHPDSFQPIADVMLRDEASIYSSLALGGVEGTWVRYWDEASTIAVLEFKDVKSIQPVPPPPVREEKKKKKKDVVAQPAAPAAPSALPISSKPVTLNFSSKTSLKPSAAKPSPLRFAVDLGNDEDVDEEEDAESNKLAASTRVAPLIGGKKTVHNIHKWNQVQEELSAGATSASTSALASSSMEFGGPTATVAIAEALPVEEEFEFSDISSTSCLLCARQFKTVDQLKRHNKESDLHKKNFKDANLRDVARQKVLAKRTSSDQPRYRDRASERRVLFNQPDVPMPEKDNGTSKPTKRRADGPPSPPPPPPAPVNPGQDETNVGNKLLKMMGWTEGKGLGTEGEGRVDPIKTAIYAEGAGLGASKGKDVEKYAGATYVSMAQDAARDRYGS